MDKLLSPDFGLMFWTLLTFMILVLILRPMAWEPLIKALRDREDNLRKEREASEKALADAAKIKEDLAAEMAKLEARSKEFLAKAHAEGQTLKDEILRLAQEDSKKLISRGHQQLEEDRRRLVHDLRSEIGSLSVAVAQKILRTEVDTASSEKIVKDFLKDLEGEKAVKS